MRWNSLRCLGESIQMQKNTSSQQVTEEIKKEVKKFLDTNENTTTKNLLDAAKVFLRRKFIAIQSYLKKQEKQRIDNLISHLKQLKKEQQQKPWQPASR